MIKERERRRGPPVITSSSILSIDDSQLALTNLDLAGADRIWKRRAGSRGGGLREPRRLPAGLRERKCARNQDKGRAEGSTPENLPFPYLPPPAPNPRSRTPRVGPNQNIKDSTEAPMKEGAGPQRAWPLSQSQNSSKNANITDFKRKQKSHLHSSSFHTVATSRTAQGRFPAQS